MTDRIKPALTPEEWKRWERYNADARIGMAAGMEKDRRSDAIAALALNGQPFGFTWEHVDRLRGIAKVEGDLGPFLLADESAALNDLADLIEALLSPRDR